MVRFGVPGQNVDTLSYADGRLATVPSVQAPRRPTVNDKKFPMWCEWRTNKSSQSPVTEGEFWKLIRFESNGDATWIRIDASGVSPGVDGLLTDDGPTAVGPDGSGIITVAGGTGIVTSGQDPSTTVTVAVDTAVVTTQYDADTGSATPTAGVINVVGGAGIDTSATGNTITVDLAGGSVAVDKVGVDANTGPGTDPVVPDATGLLDVAGAAVAAHSVPIETHSRAANAYNIEVQAATAIAPASAPATLADMGMVSADSSHFNVSANAYLQIKQPWASSPGAYGLGITLSGGTFTITKDDGTALSDTNRGYVVIGSESQPGIMSTYAVTSNVSFQDASATSDITGNLFGLTTGIATDKDIPFWIYAVQNDGESAFTFMISRSPWAATSPASANIGKPSSAVADINTAFWALDDSITVGDYDTNPAIPIGSFRMRMDASDDWTVQTLANNTSSGADGIGYEYMNWDTIWQMPTGQFGAASGRLMQDNGGTTPQWSEQQIKYTFDGWNQTCTVWYRFDGDGGTDGSGAVNLRMILPFTARGFDGSPTSLYTGSWLGSGSGLTATTGIHDIPTTANYTIFKTAAGTTVNNSVFGNGARELRGTFTYRLGS